MKIFDLVYDLYVGDQAQKSDQEWQFDHFICLGVLAVSIKRQSYQNRVGQTTFLVSFNLENHSVGANHIFGQLQSWKPQCSHSHFATFECQSPRSDYTATVDLSRRIPCKIRSMTLSLLVTVWDPAFEWSSSRHQLDASPSHWPQTWITAALYCHCTAHPTSPLWTGTPGTRSCWLALERPGTLIARRPTPICL